MQKYLVKLIAFIFLISPYSSFADNEKPVEEGTILNISATKIIEVEEDLLTANLRYEVDGKNAKEVQAKINDIMQKSIEESKKYKDILVSNEQYSVYQYYISAKKDEQKLVWRGSQNIIISGKSYEDILELTGKLQEFGLVINSLNYAISSERREEIRDSLMEAVVEKLTAKAKRAAKAMGKENVKIEIINIDDNVYTASFAEARFSLRSDTLSAKTVSPIAMPGKTQISVTGTAKILVKD